MEQDPDELVDVDDAQEEGSEKPRFFQPGAQHTTPTPLPRTSTPLPTVIPVPMAGTQNSEIAALAAEVTRLTQLMGNFAL